VPQVFFVRFAAIPPAIVTAPLMRRTRSLAGISEMSQELVVTARRFDQIDSFTQGFVHKSARQLAGRFGFGTQDREELEQQFYLKLVPHLHQADPDSPTWKALVAVTVRRYVANLIRNNLAAKRDYRRGRSLHSVVDANGQPSDLTDRIRACDIPSHRSRSVRDSQDAMELVLDVAQCLNELDPIDLELCERLKHGSISQVAREMEIPRTTINAWVAKLRRRFERRGLRKYLCFASSNRERLGSLI
jgi:DNA-directed RNA polymerase specialized sigma24 family protein